MFSKSFISSLRTSKLRCVGAAARVQCLYNVVYGDDEEQRVTQCLFLSIIFTTVSD